MNWAEVISEEEVALRAARASLTLREILRGWWLTHGPLCATARGGACNCGAVVWFAGTSRVIGVDINFAEEIYPLH